MDSNISLLLATLDLELVGLLRSAIRVADLSSGKGQAASGLGPAPNPEPRRHFLPEPVIERRWHVLPEPRIEPRPAIHPEPRTEIKPCQTVYAIEPAGPTERTAPCSSRSPIQPPWRVLPWQQPLPSAPVFKIVVRRPDTQHRGQLINIFA